MVALLHIGDLWLHPWPWLGPFTRPTNQIDETDDDLDHLMCLVDPSLPLVRYCAVSV